MSDVFFTAPGELFLSKVTPVIEALFEDLELSSTPDGNGGMRAYFCVNERGPSWDEIRQNLVDKVLVPVMANPDEQVSVDDLKSVLYVLADQFEQANNCDLMNFIENASYDPDDEVSATALYFLASCLDDGHELKAMHYQGTISSDRPSVSEIGGFCLLESKKLYFSSDCNQDLTWAIAFNESLHQDNLHQAARQLTERIGATTAGVNEFDARCSVTLSTALQLLALVDKSAVAPLDTLRALWTKLGQVGIDDDGMLQDPFLFFPTGTDVHNVWHWFERMNPQFSVAKAMLGRNLPPLPFKD